MTPTLLELKNANDILLKKATRINELLASCSDLSQNIMNVTNGALFFLGIACLSTQQKALLAQSFFQKKLGLEEISASEDKGDARMSENGTCYEFKISFTNKAHKLNLRQIRLWQSIDYYYCAYIDEDNIDNSMFFILTKEQMEQEVKMSGGYTHGTVAANAENENSEYSITVPIFSERSQIAKRWRAQYLSTQLKDIILLDN